MEVAWGCEVGSSSSSVSERKLQDEQWAEVAARFWLLPRGLRSSGWRGLRSVGLVCRLFRHDTRPLSTIFKSRQTLREAERVNGCSESSHNDTLIGNNGSRGGNI